MCSVNCVVLTHHLSIRYFLASLLNKNWNIYSLCCETILSTTIFLPLLLRSKGFLKSVSICFYLLMSILIAKPSLDLPGVDQVSADSLIDWKNNWLPSTRCVIGLESWDHIKNYKLYILWFIHSMSCRAARGTQCNHDHIKCRLVCTLGKVMGVWG